MAVRLATRRKAQPELNMAPLIDVVFLLLVFFLLTSAAFLNQLDVEAPAESADVPMMGDILTSTVRVGADGAIALDDAPVTVEGLSAMVAAQVAAGANQRPFVVRPDAAAPVDLLVRVLDEVRAGGADNVQIGELNDPQSDLQETAP